MLNGSKNNTEAVTEITTVFEYAFQRLLSWYSPETRYQKDVMVGRKRSDTRISSIALSS